MRCRYEGPPSPAAVAMTDLVAAAMSGPTRVKELRWRATFTCWETTSGSTRDGLAQHNASAPATRGFRCDVPDLTEGRAADHRHAGQREHRGDHQIGPGRHERQRGVDEDQASDQVRSAAGFQQRDHAAHRVAHEDHRAPGHRLDEPVQ